MNSSLDLPSSLQSYSPDPSQSDLQFEILSIPEELRQLSGSDEKGSEPRVTHREPPTIKIFEIFDPVTIIPCLVSLHEQAIDILRDEFLEAETALTKVQDSNENPECLGTTLQAAGKAVSRAMKCWAAFFSDISHRALAMKNRSVPLQVDDDQNSNVPLLELSPWSGNDYPTVEHLRLTCASMIQTCVERGCDCSMTSSLAQVEKSLWKKQYDQCLEQVVTQSQTDLRKAVFQTSLKCCETFLNLTGDQQEIIIASRDMEPPSSILRSVMASLRDHVSPLESTDKNAMLAFPIPYTPEKNEGDLWGWTTSKVDGPG